jgi:hypothetical protein
MHAAEAELQFTAAISNIGSASSSKALSELQFVASNKTTQIKNALLDFENQEVFTLNVPNKW